MKVKRICAEKSCKAEFEARKADVDRGWGKFCSKSCKAIKQERRTGQNRAYKSGYRAYADYGNGANFDNTSCQNSE